MSYKTGANYIKLHSNSYYGYQDNDAIVVCAEESCSGVTTYKLIQNGKIVWSHSESEDCDGTTSLIDILYALKHGENAVKCNYDFNKIKVHYDELTREESDKIFLNDEVPDKFIEETNQATDWTK